jgi:hypothetical protein
MFAHSRRPLREAWDRVWFDEKPTTMIEIARIGLGAAMLLHYSLATPFLLLFWGDDGLISRTQILEETEPGAYSVFFYFTAPWQGMVFHAVFLLGCAAFMAGWRTSWVKWFVLIGQLSYAYRNPALAYGVDKILASLLLIVCVAPIGRAIQVLGRAPAPASCRSKWPCCFSTAASERYGATNGGTEMPYGGSSLQMNTITA